MVREFRGGKKKKKKKGKKGGWGWPEPEFKYVGWGWNKQQHVLLPGPVFESEKGPTIHIHPKPVHHEKKGWGGGGHGGGHGGGGGGGGGGGHGGWVRIFGFTRKNLLLVVGIFLKK